MDRYGRSSHFLEPLACIGVIGILKRRLKSVRRVGESRNALCPVHVNALSEIWGSTKGDVLGGALWPTKHRCKTNSHGSTNCLPHTFLRYAFLISSVLWLALGQDLGWRLREMLSAYRLRPQGGRLEGHKARYLRPLHAIVRMHRQCRVSWHSLS